MSQNTYSSTNSEHTLVNNKTTDYQSHHELNTSNSNHEIHLSQRKLDKKRKYTNNHHIKFINTYPSIISKNILYNNNNDKYQTHCEQQLTNHNQVDTSSTITQQNNHIITTNQKQTNHVYNNDNIQNMNNHINTTKPIAKTQFTQNLDINLLVHRHNRKYKQHLIQTRQQPNQILDYDTKNFTNRLFHNISSYKLTPQEESLLALGLKFSIDDWYLNETYYINQLDEYKYNLNKKYNSINLSKQTSSIPLQYKEIHECTKNLQTKLLQLYNCQTVFNYE